MRRVTRFLLSIMSACPMVAFAQARPSHLQMTKSNVAPFVCTWMMDGARSESAQPDGRLVSPATIVISKNKKEVRIETVRDGKPFLATYPFEQAAAPIATTGSR